MQPSSTCGNGWTCGRVRWDVRRAVHWEVATKAVVEAADTEGAADAEGKTQAAGSQLRRCRTILDIRSANDPATKPRPPRPP